MTTYNTIEDQVLLLCKKGFIHDTILPRREAANFFSQMDRGYEKAKAEAQLFNGHSSFLVRLKGRFGAQREMVKFMFLFQVNSIDQSVSLRALSASYNHREKITFLGKSTLLPMAEKLLADLKSKSYSKANLIEQINRPSKSQKL